jgi:hypothetical protein
LAGEEIDRLLAEADVERPAQPQVLVITPEGLQPPPSAARVGNGGVLAVAPSAADPVESQTEPVAAAPVMPVAAPLAAADVEELDARVAQELNSLFTELDAEKPAAPVAKAAPAPVTTAPVAAAATAVDAAAEAAVAAVIAATPAPSDPVAQAAELEKQLLGKAMMDALGSPGEMENAGSSLKSINLSFLLKPLAWINAPLSACSDTLRETVGKVAIMTLINALAILLYVLFLRKH